MLSTALCNRMAPTPVLDAQTSKINCLSGSGIISTGSAEKCLFKLWKALSALGDQLKMTLFEVRAVSGATTELYLRTNWQYKWAKPKNFCSSLRLAGVGHLATDETRISPFSKESVLQEALQHMMDMKSEILLAS